MEMKIGKVPEMIVRRSVLKQKKHRRPEIQIGAGAQLDATLMKIGEDETFVISSNPVIVSFLDAPEKALHIAINNIWAKGATPIGILPTILLPVDTKEELLRAFMQELEKACEAMEIEIMGGHTEVAVAISQPVLSLTAVGKKKDNYKTWEGIKPSEELVMTGWAGKEGAAILAKDMEMKLRERFSMDFLERAQEGIQDISVSKAANVGVEYNVKAMHDVTSGGIFGALWELSTAYQVGFSVDLKKIPIRQETIEVCECFDINPYVLTSRGALLLVTEHANELVSKLNQNGVLAAVIGRITDGNDKVIVNDDEIRYLDPPKEDELQKAYKK